MKKEPEAVAQFQAALPATLTACAQAASQARLPTLKVLPKMKAALGGCL
jgi:hypothetical protein